MGCDASCRWPASRNSDFNPRIPYGMRRMPNRRAICVVLFQSTHPVWDATSGFCRPMVSASISIHASRMGCDCWLRHMVNRGSNFNPRIPYGMRPKPAWSWCPSRNFNPRIPYGMRLREWTLHSIIWKFLPALRADYIADIPEHLSVCIFGL